jgi:O-antigen ligase
MRNSTIADRTSTNAPERTARRRLSISSIQAIVVVAAAGILTGLQIVKPNKRVLEAMVGAILMLVLWNTSGFGALLFFVVIYPFPFGLSIGNSDLVFAFLIFIVSLARARAGLIKLYAPKRLSLPIALMVGSYMLSFYNVDFYSTTLKLSLIKTATFITAVLLFYLCTSYIDSEERLKRVHKVMLVSISLVIVFTILELLVPGRVLIPNWLYTRHQVRLVAKGYRMAGPFQDFELLAELFALNVLVILLGFIRAKSLSSRALYALLLVADLSMLFSTITRGAFITLMIGLAYLAIISRRDLNFVRITTFAAGLVLVMVFIDTFMGSYTTSGSLFGRLFATTFKSGFIPENRYMTWTHGLAQGLERPILGHGAGWDFGYVGLQEHWIPHSIYLYLFNVTGLFGLLSFLFFLYRIVRMSTASIRASLVSSPFSHAFLKVLHVMLFMFVIDQIKIEYLRSNVYIYFIWLIFGLTAAAQRLALKDERGRLVAAPSP